MPAAGEDANVEILDTPDAGPAVVRGSAMRIGGYAAGVGLSVAYSAVLIRYLGVEDFGRYATVISLTTVVAGLAEAGMTNIGVRDFSTLPARARAAALRNLLGIRLVLAAAGVVAATVFAAVADYERAMVVGTALAGAGLVLLLVQGTFTVPLQTGLRFGLVSALDLLRQIGTFVGIVLLTLVGAGLVPFLAVPLPVSLIVLGATALAVRGAVPYLPSFDRAEWRRLLAAALPYAAATAVGLVYYQITVVLLSLVSTQHQTGIFAAAFRIFIVLANVPALLASSAFPVLVRAARDDPARLRYAVERVFQTALIVGVGVALVTVLAAPFAIEVIAGPGFGASTGVLRVQGAALVCTFVIAAFGFSLLAMRRHRELMIANGAALAVSATLTLALAPRHGAIAAAWSNLAGEVTLAAIYAWFLARGARRIRLGLGVLPRVAAAAAVASPCALIPGLRGVPAAACAAVVYGGMLVLLRAVPEELASGLAGFGALLRRGRS